MGIHEKEERLFDEWSPKREGFVKDGVVDEESYESSERKLMFVLKEVNSPGGGNWDLREYVHGGARPQTWNNIARWAHGIKNIKNEINWKEIREITDEQRKEQLKSICTINLKKSPGGHTTDNKALEDIAKEDKEFLNRQFEIYHPDLVICCGSVVRWLFHELVEFQEKPDWKMTTRGIRYHEFQEMKYIIEYSHPEARVADCLLYYGLIDAVKEISGVPQ